MRRLVGLYHSFYAMIAQYYVEYTRYNFDRQRHYKIMKKIRNTLPIDEHEISFVNTLPRSELLLIIHINNINIERINEVLLFEEEKNKIDY